MGAGDGWRPSYSLRQSNRIGILATVPLSLSTTPSTVSIICIGIKTLVVAEKQNQVYNPDRHDLEESEEEREKHLSSFLETEDNINI